MGWCEHLRCGVLYQRQVPSNLAGQLAGLLKRCHHAIAPELHGLQDALLCCVQCTSDIALRVGERPVDIVVRIGDSTRDVISCSSDLC